MFTNLSSSTVYGEEKLAYKLVSNFLHNSYFFKQNQAWMCLPIFNLTGSSFNWVCKPSLEAMSPICHLLCWSQIWYRDQRRELSFMYNPKFRNEVLRTCGCNSLGCQSHPPASHMGFIDGKRGNSETHGRSSRAASRCVSLNFWVLFRWLVVVVTKYPRKQVTGIKIVLTPGFRVLMPWLCEF